MMGCYLGLGDGNGRVATFLGRNIGALGKIGSGQFTGTICQHLSRTQLDPQLAIAVLNIGICRRRGGIRGEPGLSVFQCVALGFGKGTFGNTYIQVNQYQLGQIGTEMSGGCPGFSRIQQYLIGLNSDLVEADSSTVGLSLPDGIPVLVHLDAFAAGWQTGYDQTL